MLKNVSTPASLLLLSCSILIFTAAYAFINRYQFLATETQVIKYDTFTNTMTGYRGSTAEEVNLDTGAYRNYNIIKTTRGAPHREKPKTSPPAFLLSPSGSGRRTPLKQKYASTLSAVNPYERL
mgnify:CR=1 FL=1